MRLPDVLVTYSVTADGVVELIHLMATGAGESLRCNAKTRNRSPISIASACQMKTHQVLRKTIMMKTKTTTMTVPHKTQTRLEATWAAFLRRGSCFRQIRLARKFQ